MDIICLAQHENLVRFLGSCFENDSLLVYEFVANGSLDRTLFGMLVTTYRFSIASCLAKVFKLVFFSNRCFSRPASQCFNRISSLTVSTVFRIWQLIYVTREMEGRSGEEERTGLEEKAGNNRRNSQRVRVPSQTMPSADYSQRHQSE